MKKQLQIVLFLFIYINLNSQNPILFKDLTDLGQNLISFDKQVITLNNKIFFETNGGIFNLSKKLYVIQGDSLKLIANTNDKSSTEPLVATIFENKLFFVVNLNNVNSLWKTDGIVTEKVLDIVTDSPIKNLFPVLNKIYFLCEKDVYKYEGKDFNKLNTGPLNIVFNSNIQTRNICAFENGIAFLTLDQNSKVSIHHATNSIKVLASKTLSANEPTVTGLSNLGPGLIFNVAYEGVYYYNKSISTQKLNNHGFLFSIKDKNLQYLNDGNLNLLKTTNGSAVSKNIGKINSYDYNKKLNIVSLGENVIFHEAASFNDNLFTINTEKETINPIIINNARNLSNFILANDNIFFIGRENNSKFVYRLNSKLNAAEKITNELSKNENYTILGVQGDNLYYISDFGFISQILYKVKINFTTSNQEIEEANNFSLNIMDNVLRVNSDKNEKYILDIYTIQGAKLKSNILIDSESEYRIDNYNQLIVIKLTTKESNKSKTYLRFIN